MLRSKVGLALAAALALSAPSVMRSSTMTMPTHEPYNYGRRAEKNAAAIAKAEAKRQRKMAKRVAK